MKKVGELKFGDDCWYKTNGQWISAKFAGRTPGGTPCVYFDGTVCAIQGPQGQLRAEPPRPAFKRGQPLWVSENEIMWDLKLFNTIGAEGRIVCWNNLNSVVSVGCELISFKYHHLPTRSELEKLEFDLNRWQFTE